MVSLNDRIWVKFWEENDRSRFDCMDNFRVARADYLADRERFEKQRDRGCCGSHEGGVVIDGISYWVGFNYGH